MWRERHPGQVGADAIDAQLHSERVSLDGRTQPRHTAAFADLPDGAFLLEEGVPWLVLGRTLLRWTPAGYAERVPRPAHGTANLITPPSLVAVLHGGWLHALVPLLHPSAFER